MRYGTYIVTAGVLAALVFSGHYAFRSMVNASQLQSRADVLAVRTRTMRHQVGELEQKVRTLQRVNHFVQTADQQRLSPEHWSVYEVSIQDAVTFKELAQIVEQCSRNNDLYFKPIAFHVVLGQQPNAASAAEGGGAEPVVLDADAQDGKPSDVALALKGTFLVRH